MVTHEIHRLLIIDGYNLGVFHPSFRCDGLKIFHRVGVSFTKISKFSFIYFLGGRVL